jgi:virulence factor
MRVGMIGLGDIAIKAYLPVLTANENITLHLYTRNKKILHEIGSRFRIDNLHHSLDSLIKAGIKAAFVHAATEAHFEIVQKLLENQIHVYVDKPVTSDLSSTEVLLDLAKSKNLVLMAGFNRRYAPAYEKLKVITQPNMVIMQKNRNALPGEVRSFIYDDFIHVIDTLIYLFPFPIDELKVQGKLIKKKLYHVIVQFVSKNGAVAVGIMNRDAGTTEEKVEIYSSSEKRIACDISDVEIIKEGIKTKLKNNDWEATLSKRGFFQITEDFITATSTGIPPKLSPQQILLTHAICEKIVLKLEL